MLICIFTSLEAKLATNESTFKAKKTDKNRSDQSIPWNL